VLQAGLGIAAGAASTTLLASTASGNTGCGTPAQVEGPFYPVHQQADRDLDLTLIEGHSQRAHGDVIVVTGQILDQDFRPVPGALLDVWQANSFGRYRHPGDTNPAPLDEHFQGWGQFTSDDQGRYRLRTIMPGAYPAAEGWMRPPHIHFRVSRRGYHELTTQMYFAGHPLNDRDLILQELPAAERGIWLVPLVAVESGEEAGASRGLFNILMRRVQTA